MRNQYIFKVIRNHRQKKKSILLTKRNKKHLCHPFFAIKREKNLVGTTSLLKRRSANFSIFFFFYVEINIFQCISGALDKVAEIFVGFSLALGRLCGIVATIV
jgi:hypothetical protein